MIVEDADGSVRHWTFGELLRASSRLANALKAKGVGPGDRVGVFLSQSAELTLCHLRRPAVFGAAELYHPALAVGPEPKREAASAPAGLDHLPARSRGHQLAWRTDTRLSMHVQSAHVASARAAALAIALRGGFSSARPASDRHCRAQQRGTRKSAGSG